MSLERLKKYSENIAKITKILIILILAVIACETVSFMWQALMPGKLTKFFNVFRIYAPFISNIDNNALCLFELAGNLFNNLFIFLILVYIRRLFIRFSEDLSLENTVPYIKRISVILLAESIAVPAMKIVCYTTFVNLPVPTGTFDLCPVTVSIFLFFLAVMIESTSVVKKHGD